MTGIDEDQEKFSIYDYSPLMLIMGICMMIVGSLMILTIQLVNCTGLNQPWSETCKEMNSQKNVFSQCFLLFGIGTFSFACILLIIEKIKTRKN